MSAMMHAMQKAGVRPEDVQMNIAIARYLNNGGTFERLRALVDAAERMSGKGQIDVSSARGRKINAQPRQPVEGGGGQFADADHGHSRSASPPSPHRGGGGQTIIAKNGLTSRAAPVHEPTSAFRKASAVASKVLAITVLDTLKIDGIAVGDWSVARARIEAARKTRDGFILREATRTVANAPSRALLRDVVKIEEMQRIVQRAAEFTDAQ